MLLLKTVRPSGAPYNSAAAATGFRWPLVVDAHVVADHWNPLPVCGGGLHGLPWGEGRADCLSDEADAAWIVFEAPDESVVAVAEDGGGKSKCPEADIRYIGKRDDAVAYLLEHGAAGRAVVFATITGGDGSTITGGVNGSISIRRWDGKRYRYAVGYIGEDGLEPGVPYRLNDAWKFVRADEVQR